MVREWVPFGSRWRREAQGGWVYKSDHNPDWDKCSVTLPLTIARGGHTLESSSHPG
jgi:hypothetical protein